MSSSDQDMSDTSNLGSPYSRMESPYSSPSQQVPQLANYMVVLSCTENKNKNVKANEPHLRIVEQPQDHFRFRYRSEMIGTHGCLLGKSSVTSKTKTHPTVELMNYTGRALIRCRLAQCNSDNEHPHKLLEDDQDRDVSTEVPEAGSYKVGFGGMGIIHTAKKDVPALLFKKYEAQNPHYNEKELRAHCENVARNINLNIVRLKFSAHDLETDQEICPPVFSERIHNMKSAATNDLKICRISRCYGGPRGGDDVFILVEKVNKKNIMIRFYELGPNDEEVWSANGNFLPTDVHHQYAIVFRTPKYRDLQIVNDVKVFIELVRQSDGRTSESREFTYKADPNHKQNKKRKANSSYSSIGSSSGGSLNSIGLPAVVQAINNQAEAHKDEVMVDISQFVNAHNIPKVPMTPMSGNNPMADALLHEMSSNVSLYPAPLAPAPVPVPAAFAHPSAPMHAPHAPHAPQHSYPSDGPPLLHLTSTEMENFSNGGISPEERSQFDQMFQNEYAKLFNDSFPLIGMSTLVADSGRSEPIKIEPLSPSKTAPVSSEEVSNKSTSSSISSEYTAVYSAKDGPEVKKLVKELCELIRNRTGYNKQVVKQKLERLFEMRLSNGDTFLHMTLCSNQSSLLYIVKLVHSVGMTHLLSLGNDVRKTILHLAIENDTPDQVAFLVSKGCDPMAEDMEGNNALHYAVKYQSCLEPLLNAIKDHNVPFDINVYNNERRSALHLAAVHWAEGAVRALLRRGAAAGARDAHGRTALHLAAYDGALPVVRALLDHMSQCDIDTVDRQGNTALQIVCGGEHTEISIQIMKLLLEKKADPMKHEDFNKPAWKLCQNNPEMWKLMQAYVPIKYEREDDIKSEPEDEFESEDEDEATAASTENLYELARYGPALACALEEEGAWRRLARRLQLAALLPALAPAPNPATDLLQHLKQSERNLTSRALASILEEMGEIKAANIIHSHIYN